jgi:hypothetical protein
MNKGLADYLAGLPAGSVKPGDPKVMAEYERSMREETIPAIERMLKEQQRAAHFYRLGIPDPLAHQTAEERDAPR